MIDIKGFDKARVLKALHDHSRAQGLSFLGLRDRGLTIEECRDLLAEQTYFDYLHGKVMKVDLSGDRLDERLYDRDNGPGAAEYAILDEFSKPEQTMDLGTHRRRLQAQHPDNPFGLWEIRGEDPNCDFGGHHHEPLLTRIEGNYFDAVELALSLTGFFSWGGGGSIKKVEFARLPPGSMARIEALREKRRALTDDLKKVDEELRSYGAK